MKPVEVDDGQDVALGAKRPVPCVAVVGASPDDAVNTRWLHESQHYFFVPTVTRPSALLKMTTVAFASWHL